MQDMRWMQNILPLPVRVIFRTWEDLPSLISRTSANMGYRNPIWILGPEDIPHIIQPQRLLILRKARDYRLLELLLNIDEEAIYKLTIHRFTPQLQAPEISHPGRIDEVDRTFMPFTTQASFFHTQSSTQVCPRCMEEERYGHLYWNMFYVKNCPRHSIGLVEQCPVCFSSIPAFRPSLSVCPRCKKGEYRAAPIKMSPDDPFFSSGHALILSRLGIENQEQEWTSSVLSGSPLLDLLPWQYFQLLHAFRFILGELSPDAPFLRASVEQRTMLRPLRNHRSLSHAEGVVLIATFHFIFAAWPENFFTFLETLPHQRRELLRNEASRTTGLVRDFGRLYRTWMYRRLKDPAYSFLYEAFADYLRQRYTGGYLHPDYLPYRGQNGALSLQQAYVPKEHAIKRLGVTGRTVDKLVEGGLLRVHKKAMGKKGKKTLTLIEWSSIEELRTEWEKFVTFEAVAKEFLGTRSVDLHALMDAELLIPERGPKIDGYNHYLYRRTSVEQFIQTLLAIAVKSEFSSQEGVPLSEAGVLLGGKHKLATMIAEILRGQMMLIDLDNGQPLFRRLFLPHTKMKRFREKRNPWRLEELDRLSTREAAASLGVCVETFRHWVQCSLIGCEKRELEMEWRKPILRFTKEAIETFRQTYVFSKEVAILLDIMPQTIKQYARKGILHPVVGNSTPRKGVRMLFIREEIKSLLPPGSLSLHEAATLLGVTDIQLYSLISAKRLPCFVPPCGPRASLRFFRSDLEAYVLDQVELYQQLLPKLTSEYVEDENSWLLTRDVAALMRVSGTTVRKWISQMHWTIRKETVGSVDTFYVKREDLATYVQFLLEKAEQVVMRVRVPTHVTENGRHIDGHEL